MIIVTRLNERRFAVNPDLIERIHANPDTTLVMVDGAKYIVTETMDEVIALIAGYRAQVINLARSLPPMSYQHGTNQLGLVPPVEEEADAASADGDPRAGTDNTVQLRPRTS